MERGTFYVISDIEGDEANVAINYGGDIFNSADLLFGKMINNYVPGSKIIMHPEDTALFSDLAVGGGLNGDSRGEDEQEELY